MIKKSLLLFLFLTSVCAYAASDADKILSDYYRAVAKEIGDNPRKLGGQDAILTKYEELGEKYLLANKTALHKKAAEIFTSLPRLEGVDIEKLKRIAWKDSKQFIDGDAVRYDKTKDKLDDLILSFHEYSYGVPPFSRHLFVTRWWNPVEAGQRLRELVFKKQLSREDLERRNFNEQFSPPLVYRMNDDVEKPSIAFFDGREYFILELKYTDVGIYSLAALKWVSEK